MSRKRITTSRTWRILLVVLLGAASFGVRIWSGGPNARDGHVVLRDSDTLRRLVRLEAQDDPPGPYPFVEWRDGAPRGSVLHWTRPLDAWLRVVDPLARPFVPAARGYEAGALFAGPLLGTLSVLGLVLGLRVVLGFWPALAAGVWFAFAISSIASHSAGLADHQLVWLFGFAVALPAFLTVVQRDDVRWAAPWAGAALGLALWTSAEVLLPFLAFALAAFVALALAAPEERAASARRHVAWVGATFVVCVGAAALENESVTAFRWDTISTFHLWPLGVLAAFFALTAAAARRARGNGVAGVALAALAAPLLGLLPFASAAVREAFAVQLAEIAAVSRWVHTAVFEFRPLFVVDGELALDAAWTLLGPTLVLGPLALAVVPFAVRLRRTTRAVLVLVPAACFALGAWEVKLLPLFPLAVAPAVAVAGEVALRALGRRVPALGRRTGLVATLLLGAYAAREVHAASAFVTDRNAAETPFDRVVQWLAERDDDPAPPIVLAPWGFGAELLYGTRCGVVATGYHRNLRGIHDGYAFLVEEDPAAALRLLDARAVDWVVTVARPLALIDAYAVLERAPRLERLGVVAQRGPDGHIVRVPRLRTDPALRDTMFWRLAMEPESPGSELAARLRLVYTSDARAEAAPHLPLIRVFRVARP